MVEPDVTRQILTEIERDPAISQKRLSEQIGISVGMINWHIKRCVGKGLIKLQQAPVRRYLYYLTPDGFAEKAQLTASFLQTSFDIFKKGREQYSALFGLCRANGWRHVVLLGDTELSELAALVAATFPDMTVMGIIDRGARHDLRGGLTVYSSWDELRRDRKDRKVDAAIGCHYLMVGKQAIDINEVFEDSGLDRSRLLIPGFLQ